MRKGREIAKRHGRPHPISSFLMEIDEDKTLMLAQVFYFAESLLMLKPWKIEILTPRRSAMDDC